MKKKKVLVCGASGFIGRNIFEALSKKEDLDVWGTCFTKRAMAGPRIMRIDLTQKDQVLAATNGVDILIQAAAITSGAKDIVSKPYIHVTDNTVMNTLLLQAAYDNAVPQFIFPSCTVLYPMNTGRALKETDVDLHSGIHEKYFGGAWMKVYVEKLCEFYSRLGRTKFTVIRHSNIYGPYDKYDLAGSHVFGATITKIMSAKSHGKIIVWGEGKEERDFLHVSDLVRFVEIVLDRQDWNFEVFNVGLGLSIPVETLVWAIIRAAGKELGVEHDKTKPVIDTELTLDISKAYKMLGWKPKVGLLNGIRATLKWYRENYA